MSEINRTNNATNLDEQAIILRDILNDLRSIQKEQKAIFEEITRDARRAKEEFEANNPYAEVIA